MRKMAKLKKTFQLRSIGRWFRYKYLQLTRAKGGPALVAMGFSIGIFVEMFTLPTGGLAFLLIFPLVYLLRASVASALLGFMFGKVIYLPLMFFHRQMGALVLPHGIHGAWIERLPEWLDRFLKFYLKLFVGGVINGLILAIIAYFPIRWTLQWVDQNRKEKRRKRKEQLLLPTNGNG